LLEEEVDGEEALTPVEEDEVEVDFAGVEGLFEPTKKEMPFFVPIVSCAILVLT